MRPPVVTFISPLKNLKQVLLLGGNYLRGAKSFVNFEVRRLHAPGADSATQIFALICPPCISLRDFLHFCLLLLWLTCFGTIGDQCCAYCLDFFVIFFWLWWMKRSDVVKSSVESFQVVERGSAKNKLLTNWAQINFCRLPPSSPPPPFSKVHFSQLGQLVNLAHHAMMFQLGKSVMLKCANRLYYINQSINQFFRLSILNIRKCILHFGHFGYFWHIFDTFFDYRSRNLPILVTI